MITATEFGDLGLNAPPSTKERGDLGQEDFLTLMITQFKNQDPFEPMDNGEFLGQLAQFSTVNGIESLNGAFAGLAGSLRDEQALQAANLVGREVLAQADDGFFDGTDPLGGAVELGGAASNVQIDITDASGRLVRRLDLGEQYSGTVPFDWNGRDTNGDVMPAGQYQINARVIRGQNTESVAAYVRARVESVTLGQFGGGLSLNIAGGKQLSLSQVHQIT